MFQTPSTTSSKPSKGMAYGYFIANAPALDCDN